MAMMEKKQTAVSLIAENFNLLSDKDFKSWLLNRLDYLEQLEKQQKSAKPHQIKVSHHMEVMAMWDRNEITYSRMVEILNEIAAGKHKEGIEI